MTAKPDNYSSLFFGIIAAKEGVSPTHPLHESIISTLNENGVNDTHIETITVPSITESPFVVNMLASTGRFDCLIITGMIDPNDVVEREKAIHSTTDAVQSIALQFEIPVINGLISIPLAGQVDSFSKELKAKGKSIATRALEMSVLGSNLKTRLDALEALQHFDNNSDDNPYDTGDYIES